MIILHIIIFNFLLNTFIKNQIKEIVLLKELNDNIILTTLCNIQYFFVKLKYQ